MSEDSRGDVVSQDIGGDMVSQDGDGTRCQRMGKGRALMVPWGPRRLGVRRAGRAGRKASRIRVRAGQCPA